MKIARFRQPAVSALAVLLISGAGVAFAGSGQQTAPAAIAPAAKVAIPAVKAATEPVETTGVDTDLLEEGDQTTPDAAADTAAQTGATEKAGTETDKAGTEKAGTEESGDANLPGGGHADNPNDANADHQFEGVE